MANKTHRRIETISKLFKTKPNFRLWSSDNRLTDNKRTDQKPVLVTPVWRHGRTHLTTQ